MQTQGVLDIPRNRHSRDPKGGVSQSGNLKGDIMSSSVLLLKIQELTQKEKERLIREQITSWIVGFASGQSNIHDFHGRNLSFRGVKFSGTPVDIFWGRYIEPFLEDSTKRLIAEIESDCSDNNLNLEPELSALSENLRGMYKAVFHKMAEADQLMRGEGYPERNKKKDVSRQISDMNYYLEQQMNMAVKKSKSRLSPRKPKTFLQRMWNDPVWSKVISAGIIGLLGYFWYLFWQ